MNFLQIKKLNNLPCHRLFTLIMIKYVLSIGGEIMFNIYYINYSKAFEISMLIDNKILEKVMQERHSQGNLDGNLGVDTKVLGDVPIVGKYLPSLDLDASLSGLKSKKVIDNINVVSTKSTILSPIFSKAIEVKKLDDNKIGNIVKIRNVSLRVKNSNDILSSKTLLSGLLNQIPVDGYGEMNFTGLFEVLLKDSAYILIGETKKQFIGADSIAIKIPIQADNELENQYSITDLEIGQVTVIGIYRGKYATSDLLKKVDTLQKLQGLSAQENSEIETDAPQDSEQPDNSQIHFIDVIAVIQEINLK